MAEDADARRHEFTRRAPEMRAALITELNALLAADALFSEDEAAVLRHLTAFAGYSMSGHLFVPELAALWGEVDSYVPAVSLPPSRVHSAVALLGRRGVLVGVTGGVGVSIEAARALKAAPALPPPAKKARRPAKPRKAAKAKAKSRARRPRPSNG